MCGLFGMVGTLGYTHEKALMDLAYLSALRGKDSTGLTVVDRKRRYITRKSTVPAFEFIEFPAVRQMMSRNDQLWIGHTRHRTTGEISRINAHPFEITDEEGSAILIGAHNGTLQNKFEIERNLGNKFETDSEALFNLLVEAPSFKEAINKLEGAWSLVWWDPTADTVNFCRNKERPLVFAYTADRKALIWASESWMILAACRRNDIKLETNKDGLSCYSTEVDCLYSLDIPQDPDKSLNNLKKEEDYSGQVPRFRQNWNQHWWGDYGEEDPNFSAGDRLGAEEQEATKARAEAVEAAFAEDEKKVITIGTPPGTRRGYEGRPMSTKDFDEVKANGCVWCGDPIDRIYAFVDDKAMVCGNCLADLHSKGDCLRQKKDDDDPPFDLHSDIKEGLEEDKLLQRNSEEAKRLVATAAAKAVG